MYFFPSTVTATPGMVVRNTVASTSVHNLVVNIGGGLDAVDWRRGMVALDGG
jgi:plastocyanin